MYTETKKIHKESSLLMIHNSLSLYLRPRKRQAVPGIIRIRIHNQTADSKSSPITKKKPPKKSKSPTQSPNLTHRILKLIPLLQLLCLSLTFLTLILLTPSLPTLPLQKPLKIILLINITPLLITQPHPLLSLLNKHPILKKFPLLQSLSSSLLCSLE